MNSFNRLTNQPDLDRMRGYVSGWKKKGMLVTYPLLIPFKLYFDQRRLAYVCSLFLVFLPSCFVASNKENTPH